MNDLPKLNWFCQRKDGRLVTNTYSGSYGTHPTKGVFGRTVFEYKVEVIVVNNSEMDSCIRAKCEVKEYNKSSITHLYPKTEKSLTGITKENLETINNWLNDQLEQYLTVTKDVKG